MDYPVSKRSRKIATNPPVSTYPFLYPSASRLLISSSTVIYIFYVVILRILTNFERISTFSHYQIGLAMKGVIASLINSIAIPILVNYFFKSNLYGENGLAEDVFYLGITNSFITPILTILNP